MPDARRIEELSLNSSAPPGQLLYDGWIVRLLRGKAKRARERGQRVRLVVAGDGPLRRRLERKARGLPITFLGHVPSVEMPALLSTADVVLAPGPVDGTEGVRRLTPPASRKMILEQCPLGRLATIDEVATTAVFLCSDASSFITGVTVASVRRPCGGLGATPIAAGVMVAVLTFVSRPLAS